MGTDIHGFAEERYRSGYPYPWRRFIPVPDNRCYQVFEVLANVRPSGLDSFADRIPLRGLPDDLVPKPKSLLTPAQADYLNDYGDHSFTWYELPELLDKDLWAQVEYEPVREMWLAFLYYCALYGVASNADIRIVIGFDS